MVASKMRRRLAVKNVDLELLTRYVEDFLRGKGFKVAKKRLEAGYTLSGEGQRGGYIIGRVTVSVIGSRNGFSVEFSTSKHTRSAIRTGFVTTMLGGGLLLLRGLKSQEALEKLEKDFWVYIEEAKTRLNKHDHPKNGRGLP